MAILTAVWPAILTAAREALELNHVEAGELFDSCAIHDNEWRAPNDGTVEYLIRGAMCLYMPYIGPDYSECSAKLFSNSANSIFEATLTIRLKPLISLTWR